MPWYGASLIAGLLAVCACAVPASFSDDARQLETQAIRVRVDRVNVGVIVTDARGRLVERLGRDNFHVFDNSHEQPLTDFAAVDEPAQVLLLVEAGPAVYLLKDTHLRAAYSLLEGLSPDDRVAVVDYKDLPEPILNFTIDKQAAAAALERINFNLGFGSLNLSSSLLNVLDSLASVQGKKTIVLLSTGVDTSPSDKTDLLLQQLKTSEVRLLAVSLAGALQTPPPSGKKKVPAAVNPMAEQFAQAEQFLKLAAGATGGRAYFPTDAKEARAAFAEIAQLVRHEYSLAFAPPARDGAVHSIEVRVAPFLSSAQNVPARPYRVDHRQAYLAPVP